MNAKLNSPNSTREIPCFAVQGQASHLPVTIGNSENPDSGLDKFINEVSIAIQTVGFNLSNEPTNTDHTPHLNTNNGLFCFTWCAKLDTLIIKGWSIVIPDKENALHAVLASTLIGSKWEFHPTDGTSRVYSVSYYATGDELT